MLIGFEGLMNTNGSPRDSSIARRRFSSISGPRMKPRISGAGSQLELDADVAEQAEQRHQEAVEGLVGDAEHADRQNSRIDGIEDTGRAPSAA